MVDKGCDKQWHGLGERLHGCFGQGPWKDTDLPVVLCHICRRFGHPGASHPPSMTPCGQRNQTPSTGQDNPSWGERSCTPDAGGYRKPRGLLVVDQPSCGCGWQCLTAAPTDSFGAQGAGSVPLWSLSPAAAQAAVAAAPSPALHVEAEPPAVPVVVPALLAVRKASCCRGKRGRRHTLSGPGNPPGAPHGVNG